MTTQAIIWVVDDEPDNFSVIEAYLSTEPYTLQYISDGETVFYALEDGILPDVILLDLMLPGISGIQVCQQLKLNKDWCHIPVIFVTALSSKESLAKCFAAGADDFLSKPLNRIELRVRIRSMLRISSQYQSIRALNQQLQDTNAYLENFNQQLELQVKQRTADLEWALFHDALTQLPNRHALLHEIQTLQLQSEIKNFVVYYLDCYQFQLINDSLGYAVGDRLLQDLAKRLSAHVSETDFLARIGADEFCILTQSPQSTREINDYAQALLAIFEQSFEVDYYTVFLTACLGMVRVDGTFQQADEPLRNANTALYQAKRQGQGSHILFKAPMHRATLKRLELENDLRLALERDEFVVYYQPILYLHTRQPVGFEALVRWKHPKRGVIAPGEFIACVEDSGLVIPLGLAVLQKACDQLKQWLEMGFEHLTMSINLSARQLTHPALLTDIEQVIHSAQLAPENLQFEITESSLIENQQVAIALLQALRSRRIKISLDDFGTGYSSLGYLTQFPVDNLKLDRCFIRNITERERDREIVKAVIALGRALGMRVTAEGIETEKQILDLLAMEAEYGQGYFFSRPMHGDKATRWLTRQLDG